MIYKILSENDGFGWIDRKHDCSNILNIEYAVNFLISKGWEPMGGVSSASPVGAGRRSYLV